MKQSSSTLKQKFVGGILSNTSINPRRTFSHYASISTRNRSLNTILRLQTTRAFSHDGSLKGIKQNVTLYEGTEPKYQNTFHFILFIFILGIEK